MSDSATPWTVALQVPLSMGFSGQEHRSGLSCPPLQGIFLTQGSNTCLSCLLHWQAGCLQLSHEGSSSEYIQREADTDGENKQVVTSGDGGGVGGANYWIYDRLKDGLYNMGKGASILQQLFMESNL